MTDKLIDLSHEVEHGMITYKGLPAPIICDFLSREESRKHYAEGTEFNIGKIEMVANTGTYVDSPFHRFADGIDLAELPLESKGTQHLSLPSGDHDKIALQCPGINQPILDVKQHLEYAHRVGIFQPEISRYAVQKKLQ